MFAHVFVSKRFWNAARFHATYILLIAPLFAILTTHTASAQDTTASPALTFTYTTVTVPGARGTELFAVNNSGDMVGDYQDTSGLWHGLLISSGKIKTINHPGAVGGTYLYGINSTGSIAGFYQDGVGGTFAFTYKGGVFKSILPTGSTATLAYGVNDAGQVAGAYYDSANNLHGFVGSPTTGYKTLDVPGATATLARSINKSGIISLAWYNTSGLRSGATYNGTKYTIFKVAGSIETLPRSINTAGDIVMGYTDAAGTHAALRTGGVFYKFSDPAQPNFTFATGINDKRMITGNIIDSVTGAHSGIKVTY